MRQNLAYFLPTARCVIDINLTLTETVCVKKQKAPNESKQLYVLIAKPDLNESY